MPALATPEAVARYEAVVGLEVHVQLATATKIFCGCPTSFGAPPNTNVCPVCLGLPGALPVLNRAAVELAHPTPIFAGMAAQENVTQQFNWNSTPRPRVASTARLRGPGRGVNRGQGLGRLPSPPKGRRP